MARKKFSEPGACVKYIKKLHYHKRSSSLHVRICGNPTKWISPTARFLSGWPTLIALVTLNFLILLMSIIYLEHSSCTYMCIYSNQDMEWLDLGVHIFLKCTYITTVCVSTASKTWIMNTIFLWSDTATTTFSLFVLVWLLFEGSFYFIRKLVDSNDGWNKYMRAIQLGLIDAGSSAHSLSVLLSVVKTSLWTQTALEIVQGASAAQLVHAFLRHVH